MPVTNLPDDLDELAGWIHEREIKVDNLIEGMAAQIQWADENNHHKTSFSFLYIHGFSAAWPETAPVTERLARHYQANTFQARLAGHGTGPSGMNASAEDWLESVKIAWDIAAKLGDKVIVVATSHGAPLSIWLAQIPEVQARLHALLFMSPNFRVRNRTASMLTWPWAEYWAKYAIGETRSWQPISEAQARVWTHSYSIRALQEMQSVIDWFQNQDLSKLETPLAVMYMKNDPTIHPSAAIKGFNQWAGQPKSLIPVEINADEIEHVFVGDIMAPHRNDWTVSKFIEFLDGIS